MSGSAPMYNLRISFLAREKPLIFGSLKKKTVNFPYNKIRIFGKELKIGTLCISLLFSHDYYIIIYILYIYINIILLILS